MIERGQTPEVTFNDSNTKCDFILLVLVWLLETIATRTKTNATSISIFKSSSHFTGL